MAKTVEKGSEALNARQGSSSRGGGRGRRGRGSSNSNPGLGVARPPRPQNPDPARPQGGYLNNLIGGSTSVQNPPLYHISVTSGLRSILPRSDDHVGITTILAAAAHIDRQSTVESTSVSTTAVAGPSENGSKKGKMAATATTSRTPVSTSPDDHGSERGCKKAANTTTHTTHHAPLPEDAIKGSEMATAITAPDPPADVITTTPAAAPDIEHEVAPADATVAAPPGGEVEEGEIVAVQVEEETKYVVPDLNLLPPPEE